MKTTTTRQRQIQRKALEEGKVASVGAAFALAYAFAFVKVAEDS